jgi:3-hydroxyacyl-CoA dehydrogenase / enoyl-CoA hydratase / 3-hydroxybutyryl-CoA epimerase
MTEIFHSETDADGVAVIAWDLPGRAMNVLTEEGIAELDAAVDAALADAAVKGIVITSAKADFAGGMDLNLVADIKRRAAEGGGNPAEAIFASVMDLHRVLRKIERAGMDPKTNKGGKPVAWACPGTAAGIGLEIGLACHHRIAVARDGARIGLPEIMVGLFPGAGGTTRLVRMLGLMGAGEPLLQGKMYPTGKARSLGLIHEAVDEDDAGQLLARAKAWVLRATDREIVKPWDEKGYKMPGGAPYTPQGFEMFLGGIVMTHGRTQGVYPAARAMLSAAYEGALVPFDTALKVEARWFTKVLMDPRSEAMIRSLFINKAALEKGAVRPKDVPDMRVKKLGVLGAGMMGTGIAYVAALAGIQVVLVDRDRESAEAGLARVEAMLADSVKAKRMAEIRKQEIMATITATADYGRLKGCDLAVEAVFEDAELKASVTGQAEAALPADAVFASNTSTLPISELARASARPQRFIGIHFFSPVEKMMLVEIIRGRDTGPEAIAKALDFVRQIRKTPIVVDDARFFYANRCIIPYINEGLIMVTEGVKPALIENAARQLGMPIGPLQLTDETSLELGHKIAKATQAAMGDAYPRTAADDLLEEMVVRRERLGRKNRAGMYAYDEKGKRLGLWPELGEIWPVAASQPSLQEVQDRLMMAQVLEAVRALEEGVLSDIREGDVGAILGWGFAPWSGGPFSWLDMTGARRAVEICEDLAGRHGQRFRPPALLQDMAAKRERFYGRFDPAEAA